MNRRQFVKQSALSASLLTEMNADYSAGVTTNESSATLTGKVTFSLQQGVLKIETPTLRATMEKGLLLSLQSKITGEEYIQKMDAKKKTALQLLYPLEGTVDIDEDKFGQIECRQLSESRAEFIFHGWEGDGILSISADQTSGDLIMEPSAYSSRPGVQACRWLIHGIRKDLQLIAPFFQGIKLPLSDPLIKHSRWAWPMFWEAALAIMQSSKGGFWIHCQDDRYRFKAIKIGSGDDPQGIGLDSEAYGPLHDNLSAGGIAWRINVFEGDWKRPAEIYRNWLWKTYHLDEARKKRRAWIYDVTLALSWCPGNPEILDALASQLDPHRVLIHFPNWRTDEYDQNYPTFVANNSARVFLTKAKNMGFHVMPHCNSVDMDPSHPAYQYIRDFQYRDLEHRRIQGWSWSGGRVIGVPESNAMRPRHRDKNVMVKVHPGLSMWRSILGENIQKTAQDLALEALFLDVTLTAYNLHQSLVENTTAPEGMKRLIDHIANLGPGLVVGGEGLNEITMQELSFAQAHLFKSWQDNTEGLERAGGCALNEFLFGQLCRTFGYSGLSGKDDKEALRLRIHEEHEAIPTLTVEKAEELVKPNAAARQVLEKAKMLAQRKK